MGSGPRPAGSPLHENLWLRFLRALVAVLALATLGALGLSAVALNQSRAAQENAATATFAQGDAQAQANNAATAAMIAVEYAKLAR